MTSRKFILAVSFGVLLAVGLFVKVISDSNFVAGMALVLGLYTTGNVIQKKIEGVE